MKEIDAPIKRSRASVVENPMKDMGTSWSNENKQKHVINQIAEQTRLSNINKVTNQLNGLSNPAEMDILKAYEIQYAIHKKLEEDIKTLSGQKVFLGFGKKHHVMEHLYKMSKSLTHLISKKDEMNKNGSPIKLIINSISNGKTQYDSFIRTMKDFVKNKVDKQLPLWEDYEEVLQQTSLKSDFYYSELGLLAYLTKKHKFTNLTSFAPGDLHRLSEESIVEYKDRIAKEKIIHSIENPSVSNMATIESGIFGNLNLKDPLKNAPNHTGGRRTKRRRNKRRTHKRHH